MPIYQYKCIYCGKQFDQLVNEVLQKYVECIYCEDTAKRVEAVYAPNVQIAGSHITKALNSPDD